MKPSGPNIFIEDWHAAINAKFIRENNIGYILNVAYGFEERPPQIRAVPEREYTKAEITFLGIPIQLHAGYPIHWRFEETSEFISLGLKSGKNVLVHSYYGDCRAPAIVIAFLMMKRRKTLADSINIVQRSCQQPLKIIEGFMLRLIELESSLKKA